jgi:UDP-2,4-diacetamido-2,4,6-trideoxy-beta-L-altropyranose hydrolase
VKAAFRVDASAEIGTGHVQRCLALAHALRDLSASACFVSRDLGVAVPAQAHAAGFPAVELAAPAAAQGILDACVPHAAWARVDSKTDAGQTIDALAGLRPDWLIIDHYSFDARWHRRVACALNCRIAVIDDLGDRALAADVLIDHNHAVDHRAKYASRLATDATMLVGPSYALLGPAYAEAPRHVHRDAVGSIGIFMGGVDLRDHSRMALLACRETLAFEGEIEVVTTHANPNLTALREAAARWPRTRLTLDLPDLTAFFARHDVQVGAGGGATWERCCIGAPTLAIIAAENQRMVLQPLAGMGVLQTVDAVPATQATLAAALRVLIDNGPLRQRLSEQAKGLVNGLGAHRIASHLIHA